MRYVDKVLQPGESIRWVTTVSGVGYLCKGHHVPEVVSNHVGLGDIRSVHDASDVLRLVLLIEALVGAGRQHLEVVVVGPISAKASRLGAAHPKVRLDFHEVVGHHNLAGKAFTCSLEQQLWQVRIVRNWAE